MNNLATVIAALTKAAEADNAYAVTNLTIRVVRESIPAGCVGYSLTEVKNLPRLKETIAGCLNAKNQKYFGIKVIPSNDLRYGDSVAIYCTKSMAMKWKDNQEEIPENLIPFLSNGDDNTDGLAA